MGFPSFHPIPCELHLNEKFFYYSSPMFVIYITANPDVCLSIVKVGRIKDRQNEEYMLLWCHRHSMLLGIIFVLSNNNEFFPTVSVGFMSHKLIFPHLLCIWTSSEAGNHRTLLKLCSVCHLTILTRNALSQAPLLPIPLHNSQYFNSVTVM